MATLSRNESACTQCVRLTQTPTSQQLAWFPQVAWPDCTVCMHDWPCRHAVNLFDDSGWCKAVGVRPESSRTVAKVRWRPTGT